MRKFLKTNLFLVFGLFSLYYIFTLFSVPLSISTSETYPEGTPFVGFAVAETTPAMLMSYPVENFATDTVYQVIQVIDGDTVQINYNGILTNVQLIGADTPEFSRSNKSVEDYAKEASNFTKNLLHGESVYLRFDARKKDKIGRLLAYLYRVPDGLFVNLEIIRQGYGRVYSDFPFKHRRLFRYYGYRARMKGKGLYGPLKPVVVSTMDSQTAVVTKTTNTQTKIPSASGREGQFGVDSQKVLNKGVDPEYMIAIVTDIDLEKLEKNNNGTWYVDSCKATTPSRHIKLFFTSPYPQRYDLKKGDFIGFTAKYVAFEKKGSEEFAVYRSTKILDHISSQSVKRKIYGIRGLSTPSNRLPYASAKNDFVRVTGVVMAVQTIENENPEPDNPSDYLITDVVMKCADGNLYLASFHFHNFWAKLLGENRSKLYSINVHPGHEHVNFPSQDAFGEGDVITVIQTYSVETFPYFAAYYNK